MNYAQHLQRLFTFTISSETLGKKDMWYSAPFRGKSQKGQKRCEQSQVKKLVRGQCGTWPQTLHFQVHVSFHTRGLHYISPVHNSSNTSQLWSRSRCKVKYIGPGKFIWNMLLLWCHFPGSSYIHATSVCVCVCVCARAHTHIRACACYKIIVISLTRSVTAETESLSNLSSFLNSFSPSHLGFGVIFSALW